MRFSPRKANSVWSKINKESVRASTEGYTAEERIKGKKGTRMSLHWKGYTRSPFRREGGDWLCQSGVRDCYALPTQTASSSGRYHVVMVCVELNFNAQTHFCKRWRKSSNYAGHTMPTKVDSREPFIKLRLHSFWIFVSNHKWNNYLLSASSQNLVCRCTRDISTKNFFPSHGT